MHAVVQPYTQLCFGGILSWLFAGRLRVVYVVMMGLESHGWRLFVACWPPRTFACYLASPEGRLACKRGPRTCVVMLRPNFLVWWCSAGPHSW